MNFLKRAGRSFVCSILEDQAARLRQQHDFTLVTVSGSVGKTSTKHAIAHVLQAAGKRVRYQDGNYNDRVTVPLVLFGQELPGLLNVFAWVRIFAANRRMIARGPDFDVAVLELGTDGPGQIVEFSYLSPDLAIVTAVTPEHMEFFGTLDAVADEELDVVDFAQHALLADDIPAQYAEQYAVPRYGTAKTSQYSVSVGDPNQGGQLAAFHERDEVHNVQINLLGEQGAKIALAGAAAARELGVDWDVIEKALPKLEPVPGRMQLLHGVHDSVIIDDTYNSSPEAATAALDVLVKMPASYRIAIMGGMNELGEYGLEAHELVAKAFNACGSVDLVVVVGILARDEFLPHLKETKQCRVVSFASADRAGEFVKRELAEHPSSVVLAKGSQNGVFAEEALKPLLAKSSDAKQLVRQSPGWMAKKRLQLDELAKLDDKTPSSDL